eukprot:CAMPEP_0179461020 /NCGR_PEP_ID=MMETSP0799-20121207/43871_1 /TAXON_ID=46947 /ORGANISM="Geminigera cryophila, Strain CCMP2564" /LENGTH=220 /DNA_ID=CAMNT_0021263455 /DNA_START=212 /DNA_END=871 /DNA_ORIENTATION=+
MAPRVRLMTYNMHSGVGLDNKYDLQRIARVVGAAAPDILCMQEVESNTAERAARKWSHTHADNQPKVISAAVNLPHVHYMPSITASFAPELSSSSDEVLTRDTASSYGIAIATRFKVLLVRELRFTEAAGDQDQLYMDRAEQPRGALALLLSIPEQIGGGLVWAVNTHLSHKATSSEHTRQATLFFEWARQLRQERRDAAVIVSGDLNSPPWLPRAAYSV